MVHLLSESILAKKVVICATERDACSRLNLEHASRPVGLAYQKTLLDKDSLDLSTKADIYIILEQECQKFFAISRKIIKIPKKIARRNGSNRNWV